MAHVYRSKIMYTCVRPGSYVFPARAVGIERAGTESGKTVVPKIERELRYLGETRHETWRELVYLRALDLQSELVLVLDAIKSVGGDAAKRASGDLEAPQFGRESAQKLVRERRLTYVHAEAS